MTSPSSTLATRGESAESDLSVWLERYREVRGFTERLAEPLEIEDHVVQSMPDVSPTKWHLAHVTWFFETFVLMPHLGGYEPLDPAYQYLFNSYYLGAGERHCRDQRGYISRPTVEQVYRYRRHVDEHVERLLSGEGGGEGRDHDEIARVVEIGLHHEQQHQELLLTDIKHVLSVNPLRPAYLETPFEASEAAPPGRATPLSWTPYDEGLFEIGHDPDAGFAFDNETPRHRSFVEAFELADRPVTNGELLEFVEDGGYSRGDLWLSEGWAAVRENGWSKPFYWEKKDGAWRVFTLRGPQPLDPAEPACHVSYFEADAYARWAGARLPTEQEWEVAASRLPVEGNFVESGRLHPAPTPAGEGPRALYGDVWEWTRSQYSPYPGYRPLPGTLGEYNGKFMSNQFVLRGGSCVTSARHVRATYRNFFPADAAWQFMGIRLARDVGGAPRQGGGRASAGTPTAGTPTPETPTPETPDAETPETTPADVSADREQFLADVLAGLGRRPKQLHCKYLYDERGSRLFDEITRLPEYYLTDAEQAIMDAHAAEMAEQIGPGAMLIEFGSGSSTKTRALLDHLDSPAAYVPLDVSEEHLLKTAARLREAYPDLEILPLVADFTRPFELPRATRPPSHAAVYFPGSTIGNFSPAEVHTMLVRIRRILGPQGGLLIGIDLRKDPETIEAAYNDSRQVTDEFISNLLRRANRELGADFDLDRFSLEAVYDEELGRVELSMVSDTDQTVTIADRRFDFAAGERVRIEYSHKYTIEGFARMAQEAGFSLHRHWTDPDDMFAVLHLVNEGGQP